MTPRSIALPLAATATCADFGHAENTLWIGTDGGTLVSCRLLDQRIEVRGQGYGGLAAIVLAPDGIALYAVQADGQVLEVPRRSADRANARVVATLGGVAGAVGDPSGTSILVLEAGADARLLRVDVAGGAESVVAEHVADPAGLVAVDDTHVAVLTAAGPAIVDLTSGELTPATVAADGVAIGLPGRTALLVAAGATGTLSVLDPAAATLTPVTDVGAEVRALARWGSLVLAVTATGVVAIEWGLDEGALPIHAPLGPAFLAGFVRCEADLAAVGLLPGDVEFVVEEGAPAGGISAGIEPPGPGGVHRFRVLAGYRPGEYTVGAVNRTTGETVGRARFRVTQFWPRDLDGPPLAITGAPDLLRAWGGGGANRNQSIDALPDVWSVAVVCVDTRDARMPDTQPGTTTAAFRGHLHGNGNPAARSVSRFIRECSYAGTPAGGPNRTGTDVAFHRNDALGPLHLDGSWQDLFEYFNPADPDPWAGWGPKEDSRKAIPVAFYEWISDTEENPGAVLGGIDAIIFVVQTASADRFTVGKDEFRAKWMWPQAYPSPGRITYRTKNKDGSFANTNTAVPPAIYLPSHLPTMMAPTAPIQPYQPMEVICHEIGHTFGCDDLYAKSEYDATVAVQCRGGADIMAGGTFLAQFSLANRLWFGWVDPAWVQSFDFSNNPAGGEVRLQSMETLARSGPRAGLKAGIEIRIRDGRSFYVEHRNRNAGQMGDQNLPAIGGARVLVGTDAVTTRAAEDPVRPSILALPDDVDGDGPFLVTAGTDYRESAFTDDQRMHDFRIVYGGPVPGDGEAAIVTVVYERANRADLEIQRAKGGGDWKSPDIDLDGPYGMNRVAIDVPNTVVVRVHNKGTFAADNVKLTIAWLPFTTSAGSWTQLIQVQIQTIAPGGVATARVPWTPKGGMKVAGIDVRHFCIGARVDAYVDPRDATHNEITVSNNWAQSNFEVADAPSGSPAHRQTTAVAVSNPLPRDAVYLVDVEQDHEFFRAYLGNAWVRLGSGETTGVELAYESLAGDAIRGDEFEQRFEHIARETNTLAVRSYLLPDTAAPCPHPTVWSGATLHIRAGHQTAVRDVRIDGEDVHGEVTGFHDGAGTPVTGGRVTVLLWFAGRQEEPATTTGGLGPDGVFHALAPGEYAAAVRDRAEVYAEAFFLGAPQWSASRSGTVRLS